VSATLGVIQHPSPNCGPRRDGLQPSLIVLHYTAMESCAAACDRLCDPLAEVSAHYLIGGDGQVIQLVAEEMRAWHAGVGSWHGADDINSRSIGIELDNRGDHPFSHPQMTALETLLPQIMQRWAIPPEGVIGHSDMAPGRKIDPGPRFDWQRLARQGLAAPTPQNAPQPTANFHDAMQAAGYTAQASDDDLLAALRMRHRPWAKGPLASEDMAVLPALTA